MKRSLMSNPSSAPSLARPTPRRSLFRIFAVLTTIGLCTAATQLRAQQGAANPPPSGGQNQIHSIEGLRQTVERILRQAAEGGDTNAMNQLGYAYQHGRGVTKDLGQAMHWFQKAATAGNPRAMVNLGFLYERGVGVAQDYQQAMGWYLKATHAGFAPAMFAVGNMYELAEGVPQDYAKALQWYHVGAQMGNGLSMTAVGMSYYLGHGVPLDYNQAAEWFRKAADAGDSDGMNDLAVCYRRGRGVPLDETKAREWYQKAAAAGNTAAQQWLAKNAGGVPGGSAPPSLHAPAAAENQTPGFPIKLDQRFADTAHGCSYTPPKDWEKKTSPNGPTKWFSPDGSNVSVRSEAISGSLREVVEANLAQIKKAFPTVKILFDVPFSPAQGPKAYRVKFENKYQNVELIQIMYFFEGKDGQRILMTATSSREAALAREGLFDACAHSLQLLP